MLGRIFLPIIVLALGYGFWASNSFQDLAAGVALFLFGMLCMEQGFKVFSGGTLQRVLSASTDRLWKSLSFGVVSTTLMQSSSLVSVITISFLSAEMIGLAQGIGIIFGANLGTTTGAWIVAGFGLKVKISAYAMPLLVFGVLFLMQSSSRIKGLGWILVGVGFLFLGIHFMKEGFSSYAEQIDLAQYAIAGIKGLLIFTLIGIVATVVMQSSHATLTLTIAALAAGQVTYENALALAIGANVGTTITAILGSISANVSGKRLAVAHLIFNMVTGTVALVFIQPLLQVVEAISASLGIAADDYTLKLAVFHTVFNVIGVVVMVPFINTMVRWLESRLRGAVVERDQPRYLSDASLELPEVAQEAVFKETVHLFDNAFSIIAHGVDLRRSMITGDTDLQELLDQPAQLIEIDLDEQYARMIKDIYSANIEFISRAQAKSGAEQSDSFAHLRRANMDIVAAIKAAKHLRKNLQVYTRSDNREVRREYNRFRVRVGSVLRELGSLRETEDPVVILLSLDQIKVETLDAANHAARSVDKLIRQGSVPPLLATSIINDGAYTRELVGHLIDVSEAITRSTIPAGEELGDEMSLHIEEIADIARSSGGADLPMDLEEWK
jgi:phosphate:Na+ symporter